MKKEKEKNILNILNKLFELKFQPFIFTSSLHFYFMSNNTNPILLIDNNEFEELKQQVNINTVQIQWWKNIVSIWIAIQITTIMFLGFYYLIKLSQKV